MNAAIWRHPKPGRVSPTKIYQVTDRLHDGRIARVTAGEITTTVAGWLSELGVQSPLVDDFAWAVRTGDWSTAYAIGERLSIDVSIAA